MHKVVEAIAAVTLGLAAASIAAAADDDQGVLHDTGSAISSGAKATGQAIEHGAQATGNAVTSGVEKAGEAVKSGAVATTDTLGLTDRDRAYYDAHQRGRQQLTGTVAMVDHDTGRLSVDGAGATYQLQFPPQALAEVRTGDRLVIATGFARPEGAHTGAATQQGTAGSGATDRRAAGDAPARDAGAATGSGSAGGQASGNAGSMEPAGMRGAHWIAGRVADVDNGNGMVDVQTEQGLLKVRFAPDAVGALERDDRIAVRLAFQEAPAPSSSSR